MDSNHKRRQEIFKGVLPPEGTKEYLKITSSIEKDLANNPKLRDQIKKYQEKVTKSLEAQYLSCCDYITEKTIRHFLREFNIRAWDYGLRSMPLMFNILEGYFNYRKPEIYFELIEEEDYIISFFDFVDFITSKGFNYDKRFIDENLSSDIIYNFNIGGDLEQINFHTDDGNEFIIAGVSIIRRDNEVTVLIITGRRRTEELPFDKKEFAFDTENPNKVDMFKDFEDSIKEKDLEYEYIDSEKKYIKVLIACRLDLETMTIDARYVAEETNLMFSVVTDEVETFVNNQGEFLSEEQKQLYLNLKESVESFNAIFEVAKISLYLPYFFNLNEGIIREEIRDTNFKPKFSSPITKRQYKDVYGWKSAIKTIYSLDKNNVFSPDVIKVRDDLFKIQTNGYWKTLPIDEVGMDKNNNPIHGKTWVNQKLSWFEAKEEDLVLSKKMKQYDGVNAGYIYVMRNPVMGKNVFKIGLTRYDSMARAEQLSKTSVPDKFYVMQEWNVKDCILAERKIHDKLDSYRIDPRREFFDIEYDKILSVIKDVVDEINV